MNRLSTSKSWCARTRCCWPIVHTSCARHWRAFAWGGARARHGPESECRDRTQHRRARRAHRRDAAVQPARCVAGRRTGGAGRPAGARGRRSRVLRCRSERRRGDYQRGRDAAASPGAQSAGKCACSCGRRHWRAHRASGSTHASSSRMPATAFRRSIASGSSSRSTAQRPPRGRAARASGLSIVRQIARAHGGTV